MRQVLEFEVLNQDVKVQLRRDNTFFDLISIICETWLNEARNGDGGVDDHMWKIACAGIEIESTVWDAGQESAFNKLSDPKFALLLSPQKILSVEYDFGSTTYFQIAMIGTCNLSEEEAKQCPRQTPEIGGPVDLYSPPSGTPSLDDLFPNANELLFKSAAQWVALFPCSKNVAGFVEAGPNAMGDMVFAPCKFESVEELLLTLDLAGTKQPNKHCREDAFSRMIFPVHMKTKDEQKYQDFKAMIDGYEKELQDKGYSEDKHVDLCNNDLSSEVVYYLCRPKEVIVRLSLQEVESQVANLREKHFKFSEAFPITSKVFERKDYLWFNYRREVLQVCKGVCVTGYEKRGTPKPGNEISRMKVKIQSLQHLFCCLEKAWPNLEKHKTDGK